MVKHNDKPLTVDEWKSAILALDSKATFRETGAHGWDRLDFDDNGPKLVHGDGPHWIDAEPAYDTPLSRMGRLLGSYDVKSGTGVIF
jgi:hypothetical protein